MRSPKVEKWDVDSMGAMTLDRIGEMFTPASHFRISAYDYPAGVEFAAASREGLCYVLRGQVTYCIQDLNLKIPLSAGEFARLPSGSHRVLIGSNEAVSLVMVWELPAEFRLN